MVVKPGGCAFHHSLTFHGSGPNESEVERRALVSHLVPVETRFHPHNTDLIYSRYRRRGDLSLDESFFPVLYDDNGGRSAWLAGPTAASLTRHPPSTDQGRRAPSARLGQSVYSATRTGEARQRPRHCLEQSRSRATLN